MGLPMRQPPADLGFWPFDSADAPPSPDTLALQRQHDAAVALANARAYGTANDVAVAQRALDAAKAAAQGTYGQEHASDTTPSFLDDLLAKLQAILGSAGKAAAIGLGVLGVFVLGPPLLRYLSERQRARPRANPRRRRVHRRRHRRRHRYP